MVSGVNSCLSVCVSSSCVAAVCAVVWLGVGLGVVRPVWYISTFEQGSCRTSRYYWSGDKICDCGTKERSYTDSQGREVTDSEPCWSYFPCVQIYVTLTDKDGHRHHNRFLHWSETDLFSHYYMECGTSRCSEYAYSNSAYVQRYRTAYGSIYTQYSCLYNPRDTTEVIAVRYFRQSAIFHGLFWPGLFFGLSLVTAIVSGLFYKFRY